MSFLSKRLAQPNSSAILVSSVLVFSLTLTACSSQPQAPMSMPPAPVEALPLKTINVAEYSDFVATLISRNSVNVQSRVTGQVSAIHVKAGQHVRKGQLLMQIDPLEQLAAVSSTAAAASASKSQIAQARDSLKSLQEQRKGLQSIVETANSQLKRYQTLLDQKSASRMDVEKYANEAQQAQANLESNSAQIMAQRATIAAVQSQARQAASANQQQRAQLQFYRITAPFDGVVGDIPVKQGTYVESTDPLLSVTNNTRLEINLNVPSEKAAELHSGMLIQIVDADGKTIAQASTSFISPRMDAQSQTILLKALFENKDGALKADQVVNVRLIRSSKPGLRIPVTSVVHMGGRDFVYIVKDGFPPPPDKTPTGDPDVDKKAAEAPPPPKPDGKKHYYAKQVPVTVGRIDGSDYVVEGGLHPSETLILSGIQKLADGAPVQPEEPQSASPTVYTHSKTY